MPGKKSGSTNDIIIVIETDQVDSGAITGPWRQSLLSPVSSVHPSIHPPTHHILNTVSALGPGLGKKTDKNLFHKPRDWL